MTIVELIILIYTLLGSTSLCIYLSMSIDKEVCQNPEIENQTARFVEQKFGVNVDDVLIRPLDRHSQHSSTWSYTKI